MANNKIHTLVDEKLAISLFLESLFREPEPETKLETEIPAIIPVAETVVGIKEKNSLENKIEKPTIISEPVVVTTSELKIQEEVTEESIVPEWAREPFQVLLFYVAGLKLAVPLVELSAVIEWTDTVTEMPGHADFYMGILQYLEYKVAVIDTAKMVLPTNKLSQLNDGNPRERVRNIVLIDDYRWGLACDAISEVITLQPNEVRWRTSKTSRGWLAGTVTEHMCALLNSKGFSARLAEDQKG